MSHLTIKKAKRTKDGGVEVTYDGVITADDGRSYNCTGTKEGTHPPHADLLAELSGLREYLVELCELVQLSEEENIKEDQLRPFEVTAYTIGGEGEHEGVTLIGRKNLSSGKVINLIAPFIKWEDPDYDAYGLHLQIQKCNDEVRQYLDGKCGAKVQLEMQFSEQQEMATT